MNLILLNLGRTIKPAPPALPKPPKLLSVWEEGVLLGWDVVKMAFKASRSLVIAFLNHLGMVVAGLALMALLGLL